MLTFEPLPSLNIANMQFAICAFYFFAVNLNKKQVCSSPNIQKMKIAMRRNFLIALTCSCCSFINLSAQELRGVVMDSKQHPISYAAIQVLDANDSSYVDGG